MNNLGTRRAVLGIILAGLAFPLSGQAMAQSDWPTQPIRILIPGVPGGLAGISSQLLAPEMEKVLGQPVVLDYTPGAAGQTAAEALARAEPDGHTLLMTSAGTQTVAPTLFPDLRYDPATDHAPVSFVARVPHAVLVPASLGVSDVAGFKELIGGQPDVHNFGSSGAGSMPHLAAELFRLQAGLEMQHIPYPGTGAAMTDLVAGRISMFVEGLPSALSFIQSGQLTAIGVGTREPAEMMPEILPVSQQGLPDFESYTWVSLYATGGTPDAIIERLNEAVVTAANNPEVAAKLTELGYEIVASSPEELAEIQRLETEKWAEVIRAADIKPAN